MNISSHTGREPQPQWQNRSWVRRFREAGMDTIKGFRVEANDGSAGKVEQVLYWNDTSMPDFIVVGTGRWLFGRKAVLYVGDIDEIDEASRMVRMSLSCDEIHSAPEFLPLT